MQDFEVGCILFVSLFVEMSRGCQWGNSGCVGGSHVYSLASLMYAAHHDDRGGKYLRAIIPIFLAFCSITKGCLIFLFSPSPKSNDLIVRGNLVLRMLHFEFFIEKITIFTLSPPNHFFSDGHPIIYGFTPTLLATIA